MTRRGAPNSFGTYSDMRILFLSRSFPPTIGGIEKQNADLSKWLAKEAEVKTIANRHGKAFLPVFLPWAFLRVILSFSAYDVLLLGDGVLAPLGSWAKCFYRKKKVVSIVHGLDLTYSQKKSVLACLYRSMNLPALRQLDTLICVSEETKRVALSLGMKEELMTVIPNGVDPEEFRGNFTREDLSQLIGQETKEREVIVRIGRFVKHKGVEWFIRNVMPTLPEHVLLVAAGGMNKNAAPGDHNIFPECVKAVAELGLEKRVFLLPNVSPETIRLLLNTADIAVAPNIPVPGSMEGFGISVLEAAACGLPVIASRLEGLQEAIVEGKNGILVEPENVSGYRETILSLLADEARRRAFGREAAAFTEERYHWRSITHAYCALLARLIQK